MSDVIDGLVGDTKFLDRAGLTRTIVLRARLEGTGYSEPQPHRDAELLFPLSMACNVSR